MVNSQLLYAAALRDALSRARDWLDLGCGHQFLPDWLPAEARTLPLENCRPVGVDADGAALRVHPDLRLRVVGSVDRLPFDARRFDLVTANMVVEHLEYPDQVFAEVHRVLKPGGTLIVHTPNARGYTTRLTRLIPEDWRAPLAHLLQGREEHDVYRTFYRANTVDALSRIAAATGFRVEDLRPVESSPQLYRVPVLRAIETSVLRILRRHSLAQWRPCILGRFVRV